MLRTRSWTAALALLVAACSTDAVAPSRRSDEVPDDVSLAKGGKPSPTPTFLTADRTAPDIANPIITFWAKRGQRSEVFIYYEPEPGRTDQKVFLRFRLDRNSLSRYPDGRPFVSGDSVLITITLAHAKNLIVDFQPAGLVFSNRDPGDLKISYLETDPDWNYDGVVDGDDALLQRKFAIWQRHDGDPWLRLESVVVTSNHEVEADIPGFTSYAVAY